MKYIKKLLNNNYIFYFIVIIIGLLSFVSLFQTYNLVKNYQVVSHLNKDLLAQKLKLQQELAVSNNEELRLDMARENYKISNEGEILFIFPKDK